MSFLHDISQDIRSSPKKIFESLCDNNEIREWFPELYVTDKNTSIDIEKLRSDHIQYIVRIGDKVPHSFITGTVEFIDNPQDKLDFEWKLAQNLSVKNWTQLTMKFVAPQTVTKSKWWVVVPATGTVSLLTLLSNGFLNMSNAYAITTATNFAAISTPMISKIATTSGSSVKGITMSKTILAAIIISSAAGGGLVMADGYFTDPHIEYTLYPLELPSDLHGTSLIIDNVYSSGDKSRLLDFDCNNEPVFHGLEYTFDCIIENRQTVSVTVQLDAPRNFLEAEANDCISQHDTLSDDVTDEYPYLLHLPDYSPSALVNFKKSHIKIMDDYFEDRDYESAKKHAMILLKYFHGNDIQALSTLGNIMRDESRQNIEGVACAMSIHSTPFMANTSWGKLSLAEDNHVLGNFKKASELASQVIDAYYPDSIYIEETTYKNALVIKANALFRMAMAEQTENTDEVKMYYEMAHEITPSYDTWFGLGNLDRYVSNFDDTIEKYKEAKKLAKDTTEIDHEINRVLSYL